MPNNPPPAKVVDMEDPILASAQARKLDRTLALARRLDQAALIGYYPAGFPTLKTSLRIVEAMGNSGLAAIEIGIPSGNAVLDGPVIARASHASINSGFRMADLFTIVQHVATQTCSVPLVMGYAESLYGYGLRRFADELAAVGGAGVIFPDLPIEEAAPWLQEAAKRGLHTIFVAAPNVPEPRLHAVANAGSGFLYAPASAGLTGCGRISTGLPAYLQYLKQLTALPIASGIGVSTPEQARTVAVHADAVIVGSAFVRQVSPDVDLTVSRVSDLAATFRSALEVVRSAA